MKSLSNTTVTLDITKLTECTLEGSGVLDKLLYTARVHLQDEFQQGRITGKEYSNAYIAIYDRMVQSAIAYTLAAEKAPYEIAQLEAQTALTEEQRKQVEEETRYRLPAEIQQIQAQTEQVKAATELTKQQRENLIDELLTAAKQRLQIEAQTSLVGKQELQVVAETLNVPKQGELIDAQVIATLREGDLKEKQILLAEKDVLLRDKELSIKEQQLLIAAQELLLKAEEIEVAKSQSALYAQKVITEKAQVDSSVVGAGSVIDTNNKLLNAQADAYEKEQVIKAVKLAMDTFITGYTNGDRWGNTANLQNDNTLGKLMERMGTTIGVSLSHVPATGDGGNVVNPAG